MSWTAPNIAPGGPPLAGQMEQITDQIEFLSAVADATVATLETTTSTTFTNLATPGPAQTVTVGPSGIIEVTITGTLQSSSASQYAIMGFALSGANTAAAADATGLQHYGTSPHRGSATALVTGLTPGSTTVTAQYHVTGASTGTFVDRNIIVRTY